MIVRTVVLISVWILISPFAFVSAQSPIVTLRMAKDQIVTLKTAPGITTRVVFPEPVREIICGDLYDETTGRGSFVVQRSGKDVFLKPVTAKGLSNMFVKIGVSNEYVYSFDLSIVSVQQAFRIVNILDAQGVSIAALKTNDTVPYAAPPAVAKLGAIDWMMLSPPNGFAPTSGIVPIAISLPAPPPAETRTSESTPVTARVPILGAPIKRVEAVYPPFARSSRVTGDVVVEITVDDKGKVISAKPVSGPMLLRQAALKAALGWRFTPTTLDGEPIQALGTITFRFQGGFDNAARSQPQRR